jgi:hypothetical protein
MLSVAFPATDVATALWEPSLRGHREGSALGHLPLKTTSEHHVDYAASQRSTLPPLSCALHDTIMLA